MAEALGGNDIAMEYKHAIGFFIIILVLLVKPRGSSAARKVPDERAA